MAATRTQSSHIRSPGTSVRRMAASGESGGRSAATATAATTPAATTAVGSAAGSATDAGTVGRSAPMRWVLECHPTDPVIRLVGLLDGRNVGEVRDALLRCLADRAAPIVLDVAGLRDVEPTALLRFAQVNAEVADWPAGGFVCCCPVPGTESSWSAAGVTVLPERQLAASLLAGAPSATPLGLDLDPVPGAARAARLLLMQGCLRWEVPQLIEPASVALTELVNNVVVHAGTTMSVRVGLRDGCLRLSVRDGNPTRPSPGQSVPPTALGGRGMFLVDSVARRWGCTQLSDGKLVWAVLDPADHPAEGV